MAQTREAKHRWYENRKAADPNFLIKRKLAARAYRARNGIVNSRGNPPKTWAVTFTRTVYVQSRGEEQAIRMGKRLLGKYMKRDRFGAFEQKAVLDAD